MGMENGSLVGYIILGYMLLMFIYWEKK